ncbi:MAG TPA: hypothetical protein VF251_04955 [Pyrinomonadaceae bacterium]
MTLPMEQSPEKFSDVFELLESEGARYVVVSGIAVFLHGHVRPIYDLDIVTDPNPAEAQRTLRALTVAGFISSIPLPLEMLTVLRLFDRASREVDLFTRYLIPFAEVWADAVIRNVGNHAIRIASIDHVLRVKRLHKRPHDLSDVEGLMQLTASSN